MKWLAMIKDEKIEMLKKIVKLAVSKWIKSYGPMIRITKDQLLKFSTSPFISLEGKVQATALWCHGQSRCNKRLRMKSDNAFDS